MPKPIKMATLISNSGIQFIEWTAKIDFDTLRSVKLNYRSLLTSSDENNSFKWIYDDLVKVDGRDKQVVDEDGPVSPDADEFFQDQWYRSAFIHSCNQLDPGGKPQLYISKSDRAYENAGGKRVEELVVESLSSHETNFRRFEKKWIPLPYCKNGPMGAENQLANIIPPRLYFEKIDDREYKFVIAVETDGFTVEANIDENKYSLSPYVNSILKIFETNTLGGGPWVDEYLKHLVYGDKQDAIAEGKASYLANYVLLIQALEDRFASSSKIEFVSSNHIMTRDVDCFIDFGNSNTCVVLSEQATDVDEKTLHNSAYLEIRDFTNPTKSYSEPFPSKVVFSKPQFSSRAVPSPHFLWPSPLRIGFEADAIISNEKLRDYLVEYRSYCSSPKRYLCDLDASQTTWRFASSNDDGVNNVNWITTNPFTNDAGGFIDVNKGQHGFMIKPNFSRSSLNRFAFLELFSHALTQINSINFRKIGGGIHDKRLLKNIVISCPTGMTSSDQILLRQYAEQALEILFNGKDGKPDVVPSVKDVSRSPESHADRKEWMYDEATTTQMMFMYSELNHGCKGNSQLYNNLFGKENSVRVGSIDIGGGTSDLMVCDYESNQRDGITELYPTPIFWDSYYRAGDDFQKKLIEELVIKGDIYSHGIKEFDDQTVQEKITAFFDKDSINDGVKSTAMRVAFIQEVALPISKWLMDCSNQDESEQIILFTDLFKNSINPDLLIELNDKLSFDFSELTFTYNREKFHEVLNNFFKKQIDTIAGIMNALKCDVLLLSGGTMKMKLLEELVRKTYNFSQCRIVNINNWMPGGWHPFRDNHTGFISNAKSTVSIGSLISFWGGNNRMPKFSLENGKLKTHIKSSTNFVFDKRMSGHAPLVCFSPRQTTCEVTAMQLPTYFHSSPINSPNYLHKVGFKIDWDPKPFLRNEQVFTEETLAKFNSKKEKILRRAPITFSLTKEASSDIPSIEEAKNDKEDGLDKFFKVTPYSMEENSYWLDQGFEIRF